MACAQWLCNYYPSMFDGAAIHGQLTVRCLSSRHDPRTVYIDDVTGRSTVHRDASSSSQQQTDPGVRRVTSDPGQPDRDHVWLFPQHTIPTRWGVYTENIMSSSSPWLVPSCRVAVTTDDMPSPHRPVRLLARSQSSTFQVSFVRSHASFLLVFGRPHFLFPGISVLNTFLSICSSSLLSIKVDLYN